MSQTPIASQWRNKKNGGQYVVSGHAINATNAQDGQVMVLYYKPGVMGSVYARERAEFLEKFERIHAPK